METFEELEEELEELLEELLEEELLEELDEDEELLEEYHMWMDYARTHTPPAYEGIEKVIYEQKRRGGLVCVASLSGRENILRHLITTNRIILFMTYIPIVQ